MEVTFLLSMASSGLIIPNERIGSRHPMGDAGKFPEAHQAFNELISKQFVQSMLCTNGGTDWSMDTRLHTSSGSAWDDAPESWRRTPIKDNVQCVVQCIRNALAHGNIHAMGTKPGQQIMEIAFASSLRGQSDPRQEVGIRHVMVTPAAFEYFLRSWLGFMSKNKLGARDVTFETAWAA